MYKGTAKRKDRGQKEDQSDGCPVERVFEDEDASLSDVSSASLNTQYITFIYWEIIFNKAELALSRDPHTPSTYH